MLNSGSIVLYAYTYSMWYIYLDKDHSLSNVEEFFKEKLRSDHELYKVTLTYLIKITLFSLPDS